VIAALRAHNVPYAVRHPRGPGWLARLPYFVADVLPFAVLGWLLMRRIKGPGGDDGPENPLDLLRARTKVTVASSTDTTFADVAGCEQAKMELEEVVEFLKNPDKFEKVGAKPPKGVLLEGPPGCGKTLLARAVAGEAGVPFISTSGSEFVEMFVGVGAARIRSLFADAKKNVPCIIFIDEIDAVGRQRSGASGFAANDEREATLNQILAEMDGFKGHTGVIVLAATNRPDILDSALLRPGRFDRRVWLDLPDRDGRLAILRVHTRGKPLGPDVDLEEVAVRTVGASGADLKAIANEAAVFAARRKANHLTMADLERAVDRVTLGLEGPAVLGEVGRGRRLVAYHEAGHAVAALLAETTSGAPPEEVAKVTLVNRAGDWGMTIFKPGPESDADGSREFRSLAALKRDLLVALGGRVAEELVFGAEEVTTRAARDLLRVRGLARDMVERWGFASDVLAATAWLPDRASPELFAFRKNFASEETERLIDLAVAALVREAYGKCTALLEAHRGFLDVVVEALLEHESLDADHLRRLRAEYGDADAAKPAKKPKHHRRKPPKDFDLDEPKPPHGPPPPHHRDLPQPRVPLPLLL